MSSQDRGARPERSLGQRARDHLAADMPVTERQLELAGVSTAVLEGGMGPPVLLLHGAGEFAALWARVIANLVKTCRVVAPDLPGHGASEMPDGRLDGDRVLAWLSELIEQTCPSPPALVGHLLGGAMAARFPSDHGDQLSEGVLDGMFRERSGGAPNTVIHTEMNVGIGTK